MVLGRFLKVVLILLGIVFLLVLGAGFYLYNYYVFESVEICAGKYIETPLSCEVVEDCLKVLENPEEYVNLTELGVEEYIDLEGVNLEDLVDFVQENFEKIPEDLISCDGTCKVRSVEVVNSQYIGGSSSRECLEGERSFVIEIRGKDALEIWKYSRSLGK